MKLTFTFSQSATPEEVGEELLAIKSLQKVSMTVTQVYEFDDPGDRDVVIEHYRASSGLTILEYTMTEE